MVWGRDEKEIDGSKKKVPVEGGGGGGGGEIDYKYANGGPANWPCIPAAISPKHPIHGGPKCSNATCPLGS